jgi:transposase-like protein
MVWLLDWPAPSALVFSVLIAATDPVANIAMFKDNKFKGPLCLLVESESLLNDGAAAVLFVMALAWAQSAGHAQASLEMVTTLVRIVLGGVIIGAAFGGVAILVAQRTSEHLIEAALTTVAAYGSFLAAEYFDVSGVLATVTAGLTIGVAKGALIHTDEYDIYARVSYGDTDTRPFATDAANMRAMRTATAFMKSVSIRRGFWSLLRSWLRPHRGVAQEKLPLYLAFFQFVHNARKRGRALLTALVEAIVAPSPRNPG